jgi:hypothetical protein
LEVAEIRPQSDNWTTQLRRYLEENILPEDTSEAKRIRYRSTRYTIINGELYRKGFSKALQRCVTGEEAEKILRDIHSGICGNHTGGKKLGTQNTKAGILLADPICRGSNGSQKVARPVSGSPMTYGNHQNCSEV